MIITELSKQGKITPPKWLINNLHYLVKMGSHAYGTNTEKSDFDFYGVCIPPKDMIFPHLSGYIEGFGTKPPRFDVYSELSEPYDFQIFSIVKFFDLCKDNNPNILDALFVPLDCVVYQTQIGVFMRENRGLFVSRRCWHTFTGYAYSQLKSLKNAKEDSKRAEVIAKYGYDLKAASHLFRLMFECIQLLETGTMDLRKEAEFLRQVRGGEFVYDKILEKFQALESVAENAFLRTELPERANEQVILGLLHSLIDIHYKGISSYRREDKIIGDIVKILQDGGYM